MPSVLTPRCSWFPIRISDLSWSACFSINTFLYYLIERLPSKPEFHHVVFSTELCMQLDMLHSPSLVTCSKSQF